MNVELLSYTKNALSLLIYTKQTRLQGEMTLDDVQLKSMDWKLEQLAYMKKTIQSSFEFVNYTFLISKVTRSFTHQLVRSRHNSYAQESMRAVDAREHSWRNNVSGYGLNNAFEFALDTYAGAIDNGVPIQDAREVLPTGIHTSIIVGTNLRSLSQMAEMRLCTRTAGEYQDVFKEIKRQIQVIHPWAEDFLEVACVKTGICQFPNYTECPVSPSTIKVADSTKAVIKRNWEKANHVADPSIRK